MKNTPFNYASFNPYNSPYMNPFKMPLMRNMNDFPPLRKPMTFKSMLDSANKSIDTISSIIPLYQKVMPIINTSKDVMSHMKNKLFKNNSIKEKEKVDVEIVDPVKKDDQKEKIIKEETKPNQPFF